jgi:E3 ubiquitin-protein ligase RNF14
MDNEKQKDELTALESIYTNEEFSYCLKSDQYEITINTCINLPEQYFFTYKENQLNNVQQHKIDISYLPPLRLLIILPPNYPSTLPPNFTLSCSWLNVFLISKLCKKLDELWEDNKGEEILFTWISFLQSEMLEFLKIQECIDINNITLTQVEITNELLKVKNNTIDNERCEDKIYIEKKMKKAKDITQFDQRAVQILINTNPVKMLIDYDNLQKQNEFNKSLYSCKICFTDKLGENCMQFVPCTHVFCKECIISYFEVKIEEGTVKNILCPIEKCTAEASPTQVSMNTLFLQKYINRCMLFIPFLFQIKSSVSPELFLKYDSILLNITLDTMTDIIYCPRKCCQYPVSQEPNENMANCPICQYAFCILCKAVYHGIEPCKITGKTLICINIFKVI